MEPFTGSWEHCLEFACRTDIGMHRSVNQDSWAVDLAKDPETWRKQGHLFLVTDGTGAHVAGEMASKMAADIIPRAYRRFADLQPHDAIQKAVQRVNQLIYRRETANDDSRGMGTTSTALLFLPSGAIVAHVGDSRAYRLRGCHLEQLSVDHSLTAELQASTTFSNNRLQTEIPQHVLTRSLGPEPDVSADLEGPFPIEVGDTFLLCSDGLSSQLAAKEIGAILASLPPDNATRALIDLANLRGGPDNIVALVVRVTAPLAGESEGEPIVSSPTQNQPATPATWIWVFCAVLAISGTLLLLSQHGIPAASCLAASVLAGFFALLPRPAKTPCADTRIAAVRIPDQSLGHAPYARTNCTLDRSVVAWLADGVNKLRQPLFEAGKDADWEAFERLIRMETDELIHAATTDQDAGNFRHAASKYAETVSFLMEKLHRKCPARPAARAATRDLRDTFTPVPAKRLRTASDAFVNSIGVQFLLIPPGEFLMGSPNGHGYYDERPVHWVKITRPFYTGIHAITAGQWNLFATATGYRTDAEKDGHGGHGLDSNGQWCQRPEFNWKYTGFAQTDDHPVVNVSWRDAMAFCEWLTLKEEKTYRLPTEAEWEYECRAGSDALYCFGDLVQELHEYAWYAVNSSDATHPVGAKKANAWGLFDVHGNVEEWCRDRYDSESYGVLSAEDPVGVDWSPTRVSRGGSWLDCAANCRSANRFWRLPEARAYNLGIRLICEFDS